MHRMAACRLLLWQTFDTGTFFKFLQVLQRVLGKRSYHSRERGPQFRMQNLKMKEARSFPRAFWHRHITPAVLNVVVVLCVLDYGICAEADSSRQVGIVAGLVLSVTLRVNAMLCCAVLRLSFVFATGVRPYRRLCPQHSSQHGSYHGEIVPLSPPRSYSCANTNGQCTSAVSPRYARGHLVAAMNAPLVLCHHLSAIPTTSDLGIFFATQVSKGSVTMAPFE